MPYLPLVPPVRLPTANDDVARAVAAKWTSYPELLVLVPGLLQQGTATSFQPQVEKKTAHATPYALFTVTKAENFHQTSGPYLDIRNVVIEIRGLKADVEKALAYVRDPGGDQSGGIFNRKALDTTAAFYGCWQEEDDDLKEDESGTKAGETLWVGTIHLKVGTERPE